LAAVGEWNAPIENFVSKLETLRRNLNYIRRVVNEPSARHPHPDEDPNLGKVLVTSEQLQQRISELGAQITADYAGRAPLLVAVLKGAVMFMADLARAISLPVEMDFMAVSSYGSATKTSGVVRIVKDLDIDLGGRDVIIVEDIVDSGLTLNYLRKSLAARHPASLEVCALLLKEGMQKVEPDLKYVGFRIPDEFVLGFGLDVAERYRNLNDLRVYIGP
jgi:hypoxanthine phosphoribosyltransferase